jgi:hypothetical protein
MTGPEKQYVVTYKARNGEVRYVTIGYLNESQERPEDSLFCVRGDSEGFPHMTWSEFKKQSVDLPPDFVDEVSRLLHRSQVRNGVKVVKTKKGNTTVITITITTKG